ncbi:hypothetical protein JB92DRAFT_3265267 [Gautieria morchelliformis]|nr:hypothetical protein JB92DRAFT_3265267 [Gautieria morchelliformis]
MGQNLTKMVAQIQAGGEPVLVTSLTRRTFDAVGIHLDLGEDSTAIALRKRIHTSSILMTSIAYVEAIGPDAVHRLNRLPSDNMRNRVAFERQCLGTTKLTFWGMVADPMKASFPQHRDDAREALPAIVANPPLTFNNTHGIPSF